MNLASFTQALAFVIVVYCGCCNTGVTGLFCPNATAQNAVIGSPMPIAAGTFVVVTCRSGFSFVDGSANTTIACQANGTWARIQWDCSASVCSLPPLIQYATRSTDLRAFGTTLTYKCIAGYWYPDIGGVTKTVQCSGSAGTPVSWMPGLAGAPMPGNCTALVCPKFSPPLNAWADSYETTSGTVLNVWCKVGYLYSTGQRTVQYACTGSSTSVQWQLQTTLPATPRCIPVTCQLPNVSNALTLRANGSFFNGTMAAAIGEQVLLLCNRSGYVFPGGGSNFTSTCTSSGDLFPHPPLSGCQTTLPSCGVSGWIPFNGSCYFVSNSTVTKSFDEAEAACQAMDSHLLFVKTRQENAYVAVIASMRSVPLVDRWIGFYKMNTSWLWTSGYRPVNYTSWLTGYPETWDCALMSYNGGWKDKTCSVKAPYLCRKDLVCNNPPAVDNANITDSPAPTYVNLDETLTYRCGEGFWVTSSKTREQVTTCKARGVWSYVESCLRVRCSPKTRIENAVPNSTNTQYGTYVGYTCKPGFIYPDGSSVKVARCDSDGNWRGVYTDCQAIQCPLRATPNATFVNGLHNVGAADTYTCDSGFEYSDGTTAKQHNCLATGKWSPGALCQRIKCPVVQTVLASNANVTGNQYLDTATFTCKTGHRFFIGNDTYKQRSITCLASKSWSEVLPSSCFALPCPTPVPTVNNTVANVSGTAVGAIVNYTCMPQTQYVDGQTWMTIYCDPETAQWSKPPLGCIDKASILQPSFPDRSRLNSRIVYIGQSIIIGLVVLAVIAVLLEMCDSNITTSRLLAASGERPLATDVERRD